MCGKIMEVQVGFGIKHRYEERTSIPHLLPKLLPMLVELALPSSSSTSTPALRHVQWHIAISTAATPYLHRRLRRRCHHPHGVLLIDDLYIASWENALLACSLVSSFGPIGVHEFGDADAVVGEEG